ncbi:MAG: hypothetical protein AAGM36_18890 [Cyanobacteria bacterium J06597_1]
MMYRHLNSGIEKLLEEEEGSVTVPPVMLAQTSVFSLLINNRSVDCLVFRQQKVLGLIFVTSTYELLASYTLLFTPDSSGYAWNTVRSALKANLHKALRNPIWRVPTPPEEETWLVGISYEEVQRATEPYALAICRNFLGTQRVKNSLTS